MQPINKADARPDKQSGIIGNEENEHPNKSPGWQRSSLQREGPMAKATATSKHETLSSSASKSTTSALDGVPLDVSRHFLLALRTKITLHNALFFLIIKALIIALLINFHLVYLLSKFDLGSSISPISEGGDHGQNKRALFACVKNVGDECQLYPCVKDDGVFTETHSPEGSFGYAGRFVHRDTDVGKPLMETIGDKGWGSGCVVSEKYRFVYIHVLKSGGTATKEFLRKSLCGRDDKDCEHVDPFILRPSGCRAAILNYTDYFTFSFVRNPFSRMYSMYSMMDGFPLEPGQRVTDTFSFPDFVMKPKERKNHTTMHAGHYERQTNFIFSNHTCPSFDFLGRVEHYDEDMRTILKHLNATESIAYHDELGGKVQPANTWGSNKKRSIGGDLRKEYSYREVVNTVVSRYRRDFNLLGYDSHAVPSY